MPGLRSHRQGKGKHRSLRLVIPRPKFSSVSLNNRTADRKIDAHAVLFRAVIKWLKCLPWIRQSRAIIADFDDNIGVCKPRTNDQALGLVVDILQCFRAVENEINQDLLNLNPVCKHLRQSLSKVKFRGDFPPIKLVLDQAPDLIDNLIDLQQRHRRRRLRKESTEALNDDGCRTAVSNNALYRCPCPPDVGFVAGQPGSASLIVVDDPRQWLV